MFSVDLLIANLTNPSVLAFILGAIAAFARSDLRVPPQMFEALSMYLLLAIGLKGGVGLRDVTFVEILPSVAATLVVGCITPFVTYFAARYIMRINGVDSAALAAHYGSVSAVTFMAALSFAHHADITVEPYIMTLLVILEIPGILIGLWLGLRLVEKKASSSTKAVHGMKDVLKEAITGKSIVLLAGGMWIGYASDVDSIPVIQSVFIEPFKGLLVLFLLELGVVAALRLSEAGKDVFRVLPLALILPVLFGALGICAGYVADMSYGGRALLGVMAASCSYIAAPAAVRMALPQANPALSLTASLAMTLPFNLAFGIPLVFAFAH